MTLGSSSRRWRQAKGPAPRPTTPQEYGTCGCLLLLVVAWFAVFMVVAMSWK